MWSLVVCGNKIISGSNDATVRVWMDEDCKYILKGHKKAVFAVDFKGETAVSGGKDPFVKVWNIKNGECLHTLKLNSYAEAIKSLSYDENIIAAADGGSHGFLWSLNPSGDYINSIFSVTFTGGMFQPKYVYLCERNMYAADGKTVGIFDKEGNHKKRWSIKSSITSLACFGKNETATTSG